MSQRPPKPPPSTLKPKPHTRTLQKKKTQNSRAFKEPKVPENPARARTHHAHTWGTAGSTSPEGGSDCGRQPLGTQASAVGVITMGPAPAEPAEFGPEDGTRKSARMTTPAVSAVGGGGRESSDEALW